MIATQIPSMLEQLTAEYAERNPRSRALFQRALAVLPGGNTRSGMHLSPFPFYAERGEGKYLFDVDGHRLLDFSNNNTSLILGHAHPLVVDAISRQAARGTGFSRPTELEIELGEELQRRVPSLERVRFCNSGTEAVLNCLRAAKGFSGKPKIAKFEGAYHGSSDLAMVSHAPPLGPDLGPVERPNSLPSSVGLGTAPDDVVVLPFNNAPACERLIAEHADELAAVIVDPLSTGAGLTLPVDGFLTALRDMTQRHGVLLIFDEVISFRIAHGGAQEVYGVQPDLTSLGKVIAGGTPGAAFGGREDIMSLYDPRQSAKIPQAGTFNANPLTMAAGLATLRALTPTMYRQLGTLTSQLADDLRAIFAETSVDTNVTAIGSLFRVQFLPFTPRNYREAAGDNKTKHLLLMFWLLNHDIFWNGGGCTSTVMTNEDTNCLAAGIRHALEELPELVA